MTTNDNIVGLNVAVSSSESIANGFLSFLAMGLVNLKLLFFIMTEDNIEKEKMKMKILAALPYPVYLYLRPSR